MPDKESSGIDSVGELSRRERVLQSLAHEEPDRIPVDLGSMDSTGIHAMAYKRLREHLGFPGSTIQVFDPYQMVVKVDRDVLDFIRADILPVPFDACEYESGKLPDGAEAEFPAKWKPVQQQDGSEVILDQTGVITTKRPAGGLYFEPVYYPLAEAESVADIETNEEVFEAVDIPFFCDQTMEDVGRIARELFEETDYLVMGNFVAHVFAGAQGLRGYDHFLVDLLTNPAIAECILENLVQVFIKRFDLYAKYVGPYVQVINVNDDLGTQNNTMISPELYRRLIKPYQAKLYRHIKKMWPGYLFLHSDGAIAPLIPDLIEIGVDVLNPIQLQCKGMDPSVLKREFGNEISFWGGGCDTQKILPRSTPQEVKDEVRRRIDQLAPGGGFVFNQVHNIQPDVPPENIVAMYEAVEEYGSYA